MPECHDCRCHFNPPCSACERCVHIDQTVCPEDCQTCEYDHERTGPYRLLDGTWSDGVDRSESIRRQPIGDRIKVSLSPWSGEWQVHNKLPRSTGRFSTWEAAVTYADHLARTNQGDNK